MIYWNINIQKFSKSLIYEDDKSHRKRKPVQVQMEAFIQLCNNLCFVYTEWLQNIASVIYLVPSHYLFMVTD